MNLLNRLLEAAVGCTACELSACRQSVVFGNGNPNADILIVKDSPTELEDRCGTLLTPDLKFLVECYKRASKHKGTLDAAAEAMLNRCFITSAVICRGAHTQGELYGQDRTIKPKEYTACKSRLQQTAYAVDPLVIIALGSKAMKSLESKTRKTHEPKIKYSGRRADITTVEIPGVVGDVPYTVIPAADLAGAQRAGDYDYEAGLVLSIVRAIETALSLTDLLRKEDHV
jgi:uracil-DNA glycosylase